MVGIVLHLLILRCSREIRAEAVTRTLQGTVDRTKDGRRIGVQEQRQLRRCAKPGHQLLGIGPAQSITDFVLTMLSIRRGALSSPSPRQIFLLALALFRTAK